MRRANIIVAVLMMGLAGFLLFEGRGLPFGTLRLPQTGFFPSVLALLLLFLSLVALLEALRQPVSAGPAKIEAEGWFRIGATLAALLGFALLLERLGFLLSTFLLMIFLLRAIEAPKWPKVIGVAFATTVISYLLFNTLLGIPLPAGLLGF